MNFPWTNREKKLKKLLEETKEEEPIEIMDVDAFFDQIKNKKYTFWEDLWFAIKFKTYDFSWWVYYLFKPQHQRIRKVIPRKWCDLTELTLLLNFEIIKSYVEEEMDSVSWDHNEGYKEVSDWLRSAYDYITVGRPALQKQFAEALNIASAERGTPYAERYAETNRIEALIDQKDHDILVGLAKYRQYMWS